MRDEPPQLHDQVFYVTELRPIVEYQFLEWLGADLQLPFRVSATTVRYLRHDGTPFEPDYENIHHRNETLSGPGDPWLSGRASADIAGFALAMRLGLSLPLGRTQPNPFALGALGLAHQHVQFGTGTFNPLFGIDAARVFGPVSSRAYVHTLLPLYENRYGYRAGVRILGGLEGGMSLVGALRFAASVDVFSEQPERWDGLIQQDGNLGRTDVLVGATLGYPVGGFALSLGVKVPVYQHVIQVGPEAGQLSYPAIINLAIQRTFDVRTSK